MTAKWHDYSPLWLRATGGPEVAAQPDGGKNHSFPVGPLPAGVLYGSQWFQAGVSENGPPHLLFLAGGPGGGKSHVASNLVRDFQPNPVENDGLAQRIYSYLGNNKVIKVINDASIVKPGDEGLASLVDDLGEILANGENAITCVNRGVLVEELAKNQTLKSPSRLIVEWLHNTKAGDSLTVDDLKIESTSDFDYISTARVLHNGQVLALMCVVFIDVCSLFENVPVEIDASTGIAQNETYRLISPSERLTLGQATPAAQLLNEVIQSLEPVLSAGPKFAIDPMYSNLESLSRINVANNAMTVTRAAEIISGQRFSYREVWGLIARLVVGDATSQMPASSLQDFLLANQPADELPAIDRFIKIRHLARFRFSEALFENSGFSAGTLVTEAQDPVTKITSTSDPIKDASLGVGQGDPIDNWSSVILDAFAGIEFESALKAIQKNVGHSPFDEAITSFEWALDEAFRLSFLSEDTSAKDKSEIAKWYCAYLHRLFAVSNGISAFADEIALWFDLWKFSNRDGSGNFPGNDISEVFRTLIRPVRTLAGSDKASYIALWDARTTPISGYINSPKLAVKINDLSMFTRREAETLFLTIKEKGVLVDEILIDFQLLREALTCIPDYTGTTEYSLFTAPRLERMRSSRLRPELLASASDIFVLEGDDQHPINIEVLSL